MKKFKAALSFYLILVFNTICHGQNPTMAWATSFGGNSNDLTKGQAIDQQGNIYTVGSFTGTADFDPDTSVSIKSSNGNSDIYIQKLSSSGQLLWVKTIGGNGVDVAEAITVDARDNIIITGIFSATVDFDPDTASFNVTSAGSYDVFILKLNTNGEFVWCKSIRGAKTDQSSQIISDGNGNAYISGWFSGEADFNPGSGSHSYESNSSTYDCFLLKLDSSGNYVWSIQTGGDKQDRMRSIALDNFGNLYSVGTFSGTVDFDPGAGVYNLAASSSSIYIQKIDTSGDFK